MRQILALTALACCSKSDAPGPGGRGGGKLAYPVDVAQLAVRHMQYTVNEPGSIEAFQEVQITARVAGALDKVLFVEGQEVKAGEVMAMIESERYSVAVEQAKTAVAKATATEKAAEAALNRRLEAQKESPGLVAGEEIEQKQTAVDAAKADVDAAKEQLHVANINLRDSSVRATIGGVIQSRKVQQGQYIQPGVVLATITQREPLLVRFQVTEQDAGRLHNDMPVLLQLREAKRTYNGKITLVAGTADTTTRMVPITAEVDKHDSTDHSHWLRPGAFCEVTVPVGDARDGIVVPSLAVQPTEKGSVVYVVDERGDKHIVHARVVQLGMHTSDGGVELTRGVSAGETIVVRGIDPLSDGAPVKVNSTLTLEQASVPVDAGVAAPPIEPAAAGSGHHHRGSAQ
jgi:RND family efflux transporter MFP subunit